MLNVSLNVKLLLTDEPVFVLFNTANLAKPITLFLSRILNQGLLAAITPCRLWAINRHTFQAIMVRTGMAKHQHYVNLLKNVPLFASLTDAELHRVADMCDEHAYKYGEYVVRQGEQGRTFYMLAQGQAHVTQAQQQLPMQGVAEKTVSVLAIGAYFGERALTGDGVLAANVLVSSPDGCTCVTLDRANFDRFVAERKSHAANAAIAEETASTGGGARSDASSDDIHRLASELSNVQLRDLHRVATLGVGGFGRVELVRPAGGGGAAGNGSANGGGGEAATYALKVMKKQHVVETNQQQHVINERNILIAVNCPFIVRLHQTYRDAKCLYMVMEPCLGGEVWSLLRDKGYFEDDEARFYAASAMEALEYLHRRGIIYRDLKPENMLLDNGGYAKLVDFGFAKKIGVGQRTWTFCGTPEYVAPEIVLNKGHDFAVDYWSLGIFIYELLTGAPPFGSSDAMATYNLILKGMESLDPPRHMSKQGVALVKRLCKAAPCERLGCARAGGGMRDVRKARWFDAFAFDALRARSAQPPFVPQVSHATDVSNFDNFEPDSEPPPDDDLTGWDKDF